MVCCVLLCEQLPMVVRDMFGQLGALGQVITVLVTCYHLVYWVTGPHRSRRGMVHDALWFSFWGCVAFLVKRIAWCPVRVDGHDNGSNVSVCGFLAIISVCLVVRGGCGCSWCGKTAHMVVVTVQGAPESTMIAAGDILLGREGTRKDRRKEFPCTMKVICGRQRRARWRQMTCALHWCIGS